MSWSIRCYGRSRQVLSCTFQISHQPLLAWVNCEVINLQHLPSNQRQTISSHCSVEITSETNEAQTFQIVNCLNCCEFQTRVQLTMHKNNELNESTIYGCFPNLLCSTPYMDMGLTWYSTYLPPSPGRKHEPFNRSDQASRDSAFVCDGAQDLTVLPSRKQWKTERPKTGENGRRTCTPSADSPALSTPRPPASHWPRQHSSHPRPWRSCTSTRQRIIGNPRCQGILS